MTAAAKPVVFGAPYSVYVRAVRLALEEKAVDYELVPVDIFAPSGVPPEHKVRHPFGKIPAFEHAGFRLYEASAITRYVDEAFPGPRLQPDDPLGRARGTESSNPSPSSGESNANLISSAATVFLAISRHLTDE